MSPRDRPSVKSTVARSPPRPATALCRARHTRTLDSGKNGAWLRLGVVHWCLSEFSNRIAAGVFPGRQAAHPSCRRRTRDAVDEPGHRAALLFGQHDSRRCAAGRAARPRRRRRFAGLPAPRRSGLPAGQHGFRGSCFTRHRKRRLRHRAGRGTRPKPGLGVPVFHAHARNPPIMELQSPERE